MLKRKSLCDILVCMYFSMCEHVWASVSMWTSRVNITCLPLLLPQWFLRQLSHWAWSSPVQLASGGQWSPRIFTSSVLGLQMVLLCPAFHMDAGNLSSVLMLENDCITLWTQPPPRHWLYHFGSHKLVMTLWCHFMEARKTEWWPNSLPITPSRWGQEK